MSPPVKLKRTYQTFISHGGKTCPYKNFGRDALHYSFVYITGLKARSKLMAFMRLCSHYLYISYLGAAVIIAVCVLLQSSPFGLSVFSGKTAPVPIVVVGSLQAPNHPGVLHVLVLVVVVSEVVMTVVVVIGSRQPNQPFVLQVDVLELVVVVSPVVVVVVSSRHPHQPGVLQVEVRVLVLVEEVVVEVVVVVVRLWLS